MFEKGSGFVYTGDSGGSEGNNKRFCEIPDILPNVKK